VKKGEVDGKNREKRKKIAQDERENE